MSRLAALIGTLALLAPSAARADLLDGSYRLGYSFGTGRAFLPATADAHRIGTITYHEYGGVLSKLIILAGAAPQKPAPTVRVVSSSTWCGVSHCYTTTNYEVTHPTQEDWDRYEQDVKKFAKVAKDVVENGVPIDLFIDFVGTGGDASGGSFVMMFRGQFVGMFGFPVVWLNAGMGFGSYSFKEVSRSRVTLDGSSLRNETVTGDHSYSYAGLPVRLTAFSSAHVATYLQFDLNVFALPIFDEDDRHPSLTRLGTEVRLKPLYLRAEVASAAFDPESISVFGEVGLDF